MVISGKKVVNSNRQNSSSRACLPLRMLAYQLQFRKKAACVHAPLNTCISPKKIACVAMRVTLNLFRKKEILHACLYRCNPKAKRLMYLFSGHHKFYRRDYFVFCPPWVVVYSL